MVSLYISLLQEGARSLVPAPGELAVEDSVVAAVQWLRLLVEVTGALIIALGVINAIYRFGRALIPPQVERYNSIRLVLARYLALALEFQLGADILSTAIAPSWEQIGKLGAIAVIRTGLNFFLMREMSMEGANTSGKSGQASNTSESSSGE